MSIKEYMTVAMNFLIYLPELFGLITALAIVIVDKRIGILLLISIVSIATSFGLLTVFIHDHELPVYPFALENSTYFQPLYTVYANGPPTQPSHAYTIWNTSPFMLSWTAGSPITYTGTITVIIDGKAYTASAWHHLWGIIELPNYIITHTNIQALPHTIIIQQTTLTFAQKIYYPVRWTNVVLQEMQWYLLSTGILLFILLLLYPLIEKIKYILHDNDQKPYRETTTK